MTALTIPSTKRKRCLIACLQNAGGVDPPIHCECADFNGNGVIDIVDIQPFIQQALRPGNCP